MSQPPPSTDSRAVMDRAAPLPARTSAYGPDPAQVYDVRLPAGTPRGATVVVVHGGFWKPEFDRTHAGSQAQAFADDGFAVAVVEYRRAGMPGGGWPGTAQDVAAAVAAVRADPELPASTVLVGHSAGGHLVAWAACQPWAAGLRGAVALGGCVDLSLTAWLGLGDGAAAMLMGGGPEEVPERYREADPTLLPVPVIPVHLVHGEDDDVVPLTVSQSYERACAARGREVPLTAIPGCDHFGVIDPEDPAFSRVLEVVHGLAAAPSAG